MSSPAPEPAHDRLTRRTLLTGGLAGLAVAAGAGEATRSLWEIYGAKAGPPPEPLLDPVHMQIVAHPDDCLYFVNPRLARTLDAGAGVTTVVLTAGEAEGVNGYDQTGPPDYAGYVAARNTGLRRAYGLLAVGDSEAVWERDRVDLDSGQSVEICVLAERPGVHLIFCSLWTNIGRLTGDQVRLIELWEGDLENQFVLPPADSPLGDETTVDRETVHATLIELLDRYQPVVVNTLDPDPDATTERTGAEQRGFSDHIDHTATALFAWNAVREWAGRPVVEAWRGYYNRHWPGNLGSADRDIKGDAIDVYAWADGLDCGIDVGCGDRIVKETGVGNTYGKGTHPRYADGVAHDERMRPFSVFGTSLHVVEGGTLLEIAGPPLLPALAVAGRHLYGLAADHTFDPGLHTRDVVCLDLADHRWTRLGNPSGTGPGTRQTGAVAAADTGEFAAVAVRDGRGGISVRTRIGNGAWTEWTRLAGRGAHPVPAAAAGPDGRVHLFAAHPTGIFYWRWDGAAWSRHDLHLSLPGGRTHAPASGVAAAALPDGRLILASRAAAGADTVLHIGGDDEWQTSVLPIDGGILTPALAVRDDGVAVVAVDDPIGAPSLLRTTVRELDAGIPRGAARWIRGDIVLTRAPAIGFGLDGKLRATATATDGRLHTATQVNRDGALPTRWTPH